MKPELRHRYVALRRGESLALAAVLSLTACKVGPDYSPPQLRTDPAFINARTSGVAQTETDARWWELFGDPLLNELVADAAAHNHDVRIAEANLRQARELLIESRYELLPIVPGQAGYERHRLSGLDAPRGGRDLDLFFAGFDATWELDVFGRVRRSIESRSATVDSFEAARRDVLVSMIAKIARNYFELRGNQGRLAVARRNAENQERTHGLTVSLLEGGRGTELDTSRAKSQLETTLATIPPLETAVGQAAYRIGVLTGRQPSVLLSKLLNEAPLPELPVTIAIGDPQSLLRRRPDIRVAERALAAATARIGVNTADLFPRLVVVGSIGLEAGDFGEGFTGSPATGFIGPRLTWAAFDLGRVRARIRASKAQADAELADFERTVLLALQEVDGSLLAYGRELRRLEHLRAAAASSQKATSLARQRYEEGVADFLTVLDAERRTLETQDQLADSQTRAMILLVTVYKALGGGGEQGNVESNSKNPSQ